MHASSQASNDLFEKHLNQKSMKLLDLIIIHLYKLLVLFFKNLRQNSLTIIILCEKDIHFLASKEKINFHNPLLESAKEKKGVSTVKLIARKNASATFKLYVNSIEIIFGFISRVTRLILKSLSKLYSNPGREKAGSVR
jgi:hypothetical protein